MDKSTRSSQNFNQGPRHKNREVPQRKANVIFEENNKKSVYKCFRVENDEQPYSDQKQHCNNYGMRNEQSKKPTGHRNVPFSDASELEAEDRKYQHRHTDKMRYSSYVRQSRDNHNNNYDTNRRASKMNNEERKGERSNHVAVISPNSSNLNPNALSFNQSDQKQHYEIDTINAAKDIINSSKLETFSAKQEMRKSLPSTHIDTHNETGAIKKTAIALTPKMKQDKKKLAQDDLRSTASHLKQYDKTETQCRSRRQGRNSYGSGVISCGSNLNDDHSISQYSDFALDCDESKNQNYEIYQKDETYKKERLQRRSSFEDMTLDYRFRNKVNRIFQPLIEDKEMEELLDYIKSPNAGTFLKVTEQDKDLFSVGEDYSLAHCVAEDMGMGSGIAVEFRRKFKNVNELLNMKQKSGGLAVLEINSRYIYYMVTKKLSSGKPTYSTFWKSLKKLRDHIKEHKVEKLALPRIGCGLDRLDWDIVKILLEFLFRELDISILVCNFQQEEYFSSSPNVQRSRKCKIVRVMYPITDIEDGTVIIYFASADGQSTPTMTQLNEKFKFLNHFNGSQKNLGEVIRFEDRRRNYILCGCIVKQKVTDLFDFVIIGKCLAIIQKMNKKDKFFYVGFQALQDDEGDVLNEKVLNCMSHSFTDVEIYCCNNKEEPDLSFNDSIASN